MTTQVTFEYPQVTRERNEARGAPVKIRIELTTPGPLRIEKVADLPDGLGPIALGALATRRLRVAEPITVRFFRDGEHVVAEATELDEFGYGPDVASARLDLQHSIVELFGMLRQERDRLGADLANLLRVLEHKIHATP